MCRCGSRPVAGVLDVGCGAGRVAVNAARAFPKATVVGLIHRENRTVRLRWAPPKPACLVALPFVASTTGELDAGEGFDLITACDCVHDFAAPQPRL